MAFQVCDTIMYVALSLLLHFECTQSNVCFTWYVLSNESCALLSDRGSVQPEVEHVHRMSTVELPCSGVFPERNRAFHKLVKNQQ